MLWLAFLTLCAARIINFETDCGAIPNNDSLAVAWANGGIMNATLNKLSPGDRFVIPNKTFAVMGGIVVKNISSVVFQLEGTLRFSNSIKEWPRDKLGQVFECISFSNIFNVTFTSNGKGTFDGNGARWWGLPGIGYLVRAENRPRLFEIANSKKILVENLLFLNSPYWTFWVHGVDGLEVRYSDVDARRDNSEEHTLLDLTAFNTDGFDVTGKNVWIHDCTVWNQDDCVAVKDGSENMLIERITASGLGLTIGSIGGTTVKNITFRDSYMKNTVKGLYVKFREEGGLISNILYENIVLDTPSQWAIWVGPAQQADNRNPCYPHPCSLCWPELPHAQCNMPAEGTFVNLTFRNITINSPKKSPGVIIGNASNPIKGLVFEDVVVNNPGSEPWGDKYYYCEGVQGGKAIGKTWPIPPCFN